MHTSTTQLYYITCVLHCFTSLEVEETYYKLLLSESISNSFWNSVAGVTTWQHRHFLSLLLTALSRTRGSQKLPGDHIEPTSLHFWLQWAISRALYESLRTAPSSLCTVSWAYLPHSPLAQLAFPCTLFLHHILPLPISKQHGKYRYFLPWFL